jgi:prolyl 4-hydroxylase
MSTSSTPSAAPSSKSRAKVLGLSATAALLALGIPYFYNVTPPQLVSLVSDLPVPSYLDKFFRNTTAAVAEPEPDTAFYCDPTHTYKTQLVSVDPLLIYIHNLITPKEISALLETAEPLFAPSQVTKGGREQKTVDRTSSSAGLPREDPAVKCVLARARHFLGTMIRDGWDEMGPPQLVRYTTGQRFNVHHDWFDSPRWAYDGSDRKWNRVASFFGILQDNCTGGETYFPFAKPIAPPSPIGEQGRGEVWWREHEDGGLAFRPVAGNAIFWINLHANGTGDLRTNHAGLPLESGLKTAMNIWPRHYYPLN